MPDFIANEPTSWVDIAGPEFGIIGNDTDLDIDSGTSEGDDWSEVIYNVLTTRFPTGNVGFLWSRPFTGVWPAVGDNIVVQGLHKGCGIKRPQSYQDTPVYNFVPIVGQRSGIPIAPSTGQRGQVALGGFAQANIAFRDVIVHGGANAGQQFNGTNGTMSAIRMWGIDGLEITGCTFYDTFSYITHFANYQRGNISNNTLLIRNVGNGVGEGQDGIHNDGPMDDVIIAKNRITSSDDAISLEANDGDTGILDIPFALPGPQTNIRILDNLFFGASSGIRGISSDQRIDNITIRGNKGTTQSASIVFDAFDAPVQDEGGNPLGGLGNIGSITIEDHDVQTLIDPLGIGSIWLEAAFRKIVMRNMVFRPVHAVTNPYIWICQNTPFGKLEYDVTVIDDDPLNTPRAICQNDGIGRSVKCNFDISRPGLSPVSYPVFRQTSTGKTSFFMGRGYAEGVNSLVEVTGGTIKSVILEGEHNLPGSGTGSLNISSGATVTQYNHYNLISNLALVNNGTIGNSYPGTDNTYTLDTDTHLPLIIPASFNIELEAYYRLNETSGTTTTDSSGNGHVLTASTTIVSTTGLNSTLGTAVQFNGTNFFSSTDAIFEPTNGPFTITVWFKLGSSSGTQIILGKGAGIFGEIGLLLYYTAGQLALQIGSGGCNVALPSPTAWNFARIALAPEPLQILSVNNGQPVYDKITSLFNSSAYPFRISNDSRSGGGDPLSNLSAVQALMVSGRYMSENEVAAIYNSGNGYPVA